MGATLPASPADSRRTFVLLGRIPIFDRHLEVIGYELACATTFDDADSTESTRNAGAVESLSTSRMETLLSETEGVDCLVGSKRAWLTISHHGSDDEPPLSLTPSRCVLRVLREGERSGARESPSASKSSGERSDRSADEQDIRSLGESLRKRGYPLAVSAWSEEARSLDDLASFTLVDPDLQNDKLGECLDLINDPRRGAVMAGVRSLQQVLEWSRAGATLFQGHVLSKPTGEPADALSPGRLACVELISRLRDPDTTPKDLARILSGDVSLSYRVLHVSSLGASSGLRRPVRSIEEAVVLLGRDRLSSWVTFMTLADMSPHANEQVTIALVRARMCELLATSVEPSLTDEAFTAGLISGITLIVGGQPSQLVAKMSVTDDIADAVLEQRGMLGSILVDVCGWEVATKLPALRSGIGHTQVGSHYLAALEWASQIARTVESAAA